MAINIKFDLAGNPEPPTIILATKSGNKLGQLDVNQESIDIDDKFNDASEFSFTLNKYYFDEKEEKEKITNLWDKVVDFKLVYCEEWDLWFEITVELDEETETVKTVFCTQLGQAELSQLNLYNMHINEEGDTNWDTKNEIHKSTILWDKDDKSISLLDRMLKDKAPHYSIIHVDDTIKNLVRSFSFDGISIYDAFMDIAEEIGCLFVFHSNSDENGRIQRTISVYDLQQNCLNPNCKHRGEFTDTCPKCGGKDESGEVVYGIKHYGNDTLIFVTSDELAEGGIQLTTDTDAVKNCFKLEAGDDLMTATVRNCNPNGSDYMWRFSDKMKSDMSEELIDALEKYDIKYKEYHDAHVSKIDMSAYNTLVEKYEKMYNINSAHCLNCGNKGDFTESCPECKSNNLLVGSRLEEKDGEIVGYPSLMNAYYDVIDLSLYLKSSLMPNVDINDELKAEGYAAMLTEEALSPVAVDVDNAESITLSTANSAVTSMAKIIVKSTYKVVVNASSISDNVEDDKVVSKTWKGNFKITNYSDDKDTAISEVIEVKVNTDEETFIKQKIDKALNNKNTDNYSISGLFEKELIVISDEINKINDEIDKLTEELNKDPDNLDLVNQLEIIISNKLELMLSYANGNKYIGSFYDSLKKYALNPLKSFYDACEECLTIMQDQGASDEKLKPDLYEKLYNPYRKKHQAIADEILIRENEVNSLSGVWDETDEDNKTLEVWGLQQYIEECRDIIQNELDFQNFLENYLEDKNVNLWHELCAYRREDTYSNENYISDGLNNAELFKKASEFYTVAENEIYKASEEQHSISTTLKNLLSIDKFRGLVNSFELGNWIRIQVNDNVYKLRLLEYKIDFSNFDTIPVEFSDVTKIKNGITDVQNTLNQASSMATSYNSVKRQANHGEKGNTVVSNWIENGLKATQTKIVNSVDENLLFGNNGLWCRQYDPITKTYSNEQIKIIGSTIAITDDAWNTTKTAIGKYIYVNEDGEEKVAYGVLADTIVGRLIIGENLIITAGNDNKLTFNEKGLVVENKTNKIIINPDDKSIFNIKNGENNIFYLDDKGELFITGNINTLNNSQINANNITGLHDIAFSGDYNDLKEGTKPESLKNPNKLIITGAASAEYDGSKEVKVNISSNGNNILDNKTVILLGDSNAINWANTNPFSEISPNTEFISYAKGGARWNTSVENNILVQFEKITKTPDYIILWAGGNDMTNHFPNFGISNIGKAIDGSGTDTIPSMQHILYSIRTKYPKCKVLGIVRNNKGSQDKNKQDFIYHYIEHVYRDFNVPYIDFDLVGNITDSIEECHNTNYKDASHYNDEALGYITKQIIYTMQNGMVSSPHRPCSHYWCPDTIIGEDAAQAYAFSTLCSPRNGIHGSVRYLRNSGDTSYAFFQIEGNDNRCIATEDGTASLKVQNASGSVFGKSIMKYMYNTSKSLNVNNMIEGIHYFAGGSASNITGLPSTYSGTSAMILEVYTNNDNGYRFLRMQDYDGNLWTGKCSYNGSPKWYKINATAE